MKYTLKSLCCVGLLVGLAAFARGDEKTLTGKISDDMCGASHAKMMAKHADAKTDRDCTLACVQGGAKYVFVSSGKVYKIENQDLADLKTHAGHTVKVAGETKGDSITISKIEMPAKKKS